MNNCIFVFLLVTDYDNIIYRFSNVFRHTVNKRKTASVGQRNSEHTSDHRSTKIDLFRKRFYPLPTIYYRLPNNSEIVLNCTNKKSKLLLLLRLVWCDRIIVSTRTRAEWKRKIVQTYWSIVFKSRRLVD